mgnify:CR=1 FL=1
MLRNDVSYPYPILRTDTGDFDNSVFTDKFELKTVQNGYELTPKFSVNNSYIEKLIEEGKLKYAVSIICKSTLLREMRYVENDGTPIFLAAETVHYQVNYGGYIVAVQDIEDYIDTDFSEGYRGISFKLSRGAVVGIGNERHFKALFEKDVINDASSIISVLGSDQEKFMKVDLHCEHINVILPTAQCSMYKRCGGKTQEYTILHSVVIIPALVEAISTMKKEIAAMENGEEDDSLVERPWFITLSQIIRKLADSMGEPEYILYDYPVRTAQIIMGNNSGAALKIIEERL